jgi:hypothetical protein
MQLYVTFERYHELRQGMAVAREDTIVKRALEHGIRARAAPEAEYARAVHERDL